MKKLVLPIIFALALAFTAVASADVPTFSVERAHIVANPYINCGTFVVIGEFDVTRKIATFYDSDGNAIRRVAHISVDGTVTNALTGASLLISREGTFTQDLVDGSTVTAGQRTRVVAPGTGIVLQDTGIIVREGGVIVLQGGPRDFLDYQLGDTSGIQNLCAALAA